MNRFLFNCALAIGVCSISIAQANDCCPVQYDNCCNDSGFDGWYIGGNVGAFTHEAHRTDLDEFMVDAATYTFKTTDVTAGLQLGYDWNCCGNVFGLVGDWNWVNNNRTFGIAPNEIPGQSIRNRVHWFSTIRVRAGSAINNSALIYVTAGAAVSRFNTRWNDGSSAFNNQDTRWGWAGGVGTEFLLGCNWSFGLELLCMHFDERVKEFSVTGTSFPFAFGHSDNAYVGRVLLNYRFGDLCGCW